MSNAAVTLGPGPVIISLTQLVEDNVSALYTSTTQSNFDDAFNAFLAKHAKITLNGKHLTVEQYKRQLQDQKLLEQGAEVSFNGAVEVPKDPKQPVAAGTVGLFFTATVVERIDEFGVPVTSTVTSSLNVTVVEEGGLLDRQVSVLNQVMVSEANPITPPKGISTSAST